MTDIADTEEDLDPVSEWLLAAGSKQVLVVLGPHARADGSVGRVVRTLTPDFHNLVHCASEIAASNDFGLEWRKTSGSLVAFGTLGREPGWKKSWFDQGYSSFVRAEIPLPAGRAFECYLFTQQQLRETREAAHLAWSMLTLWPQIKADIALRLSTLTPEEGRCLEFALEGLSAKETGDAMEIPERRVNLHIQRAMAKLDAPNKTAAIHRALWVGAI